MSDTISITCLAFYLVGSVFLPRLDYYYIVQKCDKDFLIFRKGVKVANSSWLILYSNFAEI